jgi:hypothetical protein
MNRSLFSLAALGLSIHVFAADTSMQLDGKTPVLRGPATTLSRPAGASHPALAPAPAPVVTPKVVTAKFLTAEIKVGEWASLKVDGINLGAGRMCGGTVTWGDGTQFDNMLGDNGQWLTLKKGYAQAGNYTAVVMPKSYSGSPCVSDAPIQVSIKVNPPAPLPPSQLTKLVVTPMVNPKARLIGTKWVGSAANSACSYVLHFGDGTSKKTGAGTVQPGSDEQHVYAPGTYSAIVTPSNADFDNCTLGPDAGPKTFTVE